MQLFISPHMILNRYDLNSVNIMKSYMDMQLKF